MVMCWVTLVVTCHNVVIAAGYDYGVFSLYFLDWLPLDLGIFLFLALILLRVVSRRYLNYRINDHIKVRGLFSGFQE